MSRCNRFKRCFAFFRASDSKAGFGLKAGGLKGASAEGVVIAPTGGCALDSVVEINGSAIPKNGCADADIYTPQ